MDISSQRRCLGAITGGLLVGAAGAIAWSLSGIEQPNVATLSPPNQLAAPAVSGVSELSALDDRIAAQPIRRPLYDPPPPVRRAPPAEPRRAPAPPPQPRLEVTLVGTIIKAEQSLAIVADASGNFDIKGIGESLDLSPEGITIENIESEQVTLQYQGRQSTFQLDRQAKKTNPEGKRARDRKKNR